MLFDYTICSARHLLRSDLGWKGDENVVAPLVNSGISVCTYIYKYVHTCTCSLCLSKHRDLEIHIAASRYLFPSVKIWRNAL